MPHDSSAYPDGMSNNQQHSKSSDRLLDLGYIAGRRVTLSGEHFEIASDPFIDGAWVAVRVTSENDPTIQTIRLPLSILLGLTNLLPSPQVS